MSDLTRPPGPRGPRPPGLIPSIPPLPFLLGILLGFVAQALIPLDLGGNAVRIGGIVLGVGAVLLFGWAERTMSHAGTHAAPRAPTTALVTSGPFRFSRNPIYIAYALFTVAILLVATSAWGLVFAALAVVVVDRLVIADEEQRLWHMFGDAYDDYRHEVRRWL
jgi:protein-S-isoprenylcysteine O-methyltransferase Ste14